MGVALTDAQPFSVRVHFIDDNMINYCWRGVVSGVAVVVSLVIR